jgi:uroporphyrinogen-III synthase
MKQRPLAGRRVLVTRAAHQAGKLSDGLRLLGVEPVEVPVIEIQPPASYEPLDAALLQLYNYDWLILTSANAARALALRALALGFVLEPPSQLKVAAVGEATAAAAVKAGFKVDFIPEDYIAESLVEGMLAGPHFRSLGKRVLLVRASVARDAIPEAMREAGVVIDVVNAYQNQMPEAAPEQLRKAVHAGLDAVTFTSSSSATHLAEAAAAAGVAWPIAGALAVSIGEITSETLRELGWEPAVEANPSDIPGLIAAVLRALTPPRSH